MITRRAALVGGLAIIASPAFLKKRAFASDAGRGSGPIL